VRREGYKRKKLKPERRNEKERKFEGNKEEVKTAKEGD
jgi:hypothetical protein